MRPYFCKNLSVVIYMKFRNVPIFKDFPPICPYFLGFRVGKYGTCQQLIIRVQKRSTKQTRDASFQAKA